MKHLIKIALLFPMIALLASCAEPRNQVLTPNNRNEIKNTKAILNTTQSGIRLQENDAFFSKLSNSYDPMDSGYIVHQNTASGGSLLVDAIYIGLQNHDINEDKKTISPVRKSLGAFNYLDYFKNDLNKNLSQLHWLNLNKTQTSYHIITDDEKKLVNASKENTTLFIGSTYALSGNFRRLGVAAYVKLDEKATKTQPMKTLYKRRFFYVYYLNFPENDLEKNKQAWTQNNGKLLKEKLKDASRILSKLIAKDMRNENDQYQFLNTKVVSMREFSGYKVNAKVLPDLDGYHILYIIGDGSIYAVNFYY